MKPDRLGDLLAQFHRWFSTMGGLRGGAAIYWWLLVVSIVALFALVLLWDVWAIFWLFWS